MSIFDFSEYQGTIDFGKVKCDTDLLILRVQAGSTHPDIYYAQYVSGCKANNIPFGTYAYARFISVADAQQEAKDCFARMDKETQFVVIDVESVSTTIASQLVPATQAFIDYLHSQGVKKVGLYSGENFYKTNGLSAVNVDFLWIANYGINDGNQHNRPTIACDLWQYASVGTESGVVGHVDVDALNGSKPLSYFTGVESTVTTSATKTIFLPASNDTWTVYKMGHPCSKSDPANIAGQLTPKQFGGLTYDILGTTAPDCYIINTSIAGQVQIYGAPSTGAIIKDKGLQVGNTVTVKDTALNYQTGESIIPQVRGTKHNIVQIKDVSQSYSQKAYLLSDIMSWVLEQDIVESGVDNHVVAPPPPPPVPAPQPAPVVAPMIEPAPKPVASAPVEAPKPVEQPQPAPVVVVAPTPVPAVEKMVVAPSVQPSVNAPVVPSANAPIKSTSGLNIAQVSGNTISGNAVDVPSLAQQIENAVLKDPQLQKSIVQKILDFFVSLFK